MGLTYGNSRRQPRSFLLSPTFSADRLAINPATGKPFLGVSGGPLTAPLSEQQGGVTSLANGPEGLSSEIAPKALPDGSLQLSEGSGVNATGTVKQKAAPAAGAAGTAINLNTPGTIGGPLENIAAGNLQIGSQAPAAQDQASLAGNLDLQTDASKSLYQEPANLETAVPPPSGETQEGEFIIDAEGLKHVFNYNTGQYEVQSGNRYTGSGDMIEVDPFGPEPAGAQWTWSEKEQMWRPTQEVADYWTWDPSSNTYKLKSYFSAPEEAPAEPGEPAGPETVNSLEDLRGMSDYIWNFLQSMKDGSVKDLNPDTWAAAQDMLKTLTDNLNNLPEGLNQADLEALMGPIENIQALLAEVEAMPEWKMSMDPGMLQQIEAARSRIQGMMAGVDVNAPLNVMPDETGKDQWKDFLSKVLGLTGTGEFQVSLEDLLGPEGVAAKNLTGEQYDELVNSVKGILAQAEEGDFENAWTNPLGEIDPETGKLKYGYDEREEAMRQQLYETIQRRMGYNPDTGEYTGQAGFEPELKQKLLDQARARLEAEAINRGIYRSPAGLAGEARYMADVDVQDLLYADTKQEKAIDQGMRLAEYMSTEDRARRQELLQVSQVEEQIRANRAAELASYRGEVSKLLESKDKYQQDWARIELDRIESEERINDMRRTSNQALMELQRKTAATEVDRQKAQEEIQASRRASMLAAENQLESSLWKEIELRASMDQAERDDVLKMLEMKADLSQEEFQMLNDRLDALNQRATVIAQIKDMNIDNLTQFILNQQELAVQVFGAESQRIFNQANTLIQMYQTDYEGHLGELDRILKAKDLDFNQYITSIMTEDYMKRSLQAQDIADLNVLFELIGLPQITAGSSLLDVLGGESDTEKGRYDNAVDQFMYAISSFLEGFGPET